MTVLGLNVFDLAVLGIIVLSGLFALMRGLVKEVLSIVSWVGALFAALYGFPYVRPFANRLIQPAMLADAITGVGLFVIALIILGLIATIISGAVRKSSAGALDRSLGFLFGLLRGAVIVCVAWLAMAWAFASHQTQPDWIRDARTLPMVERGANFLVGLVPGHALAATPSRAGAKAPDDMPGTGYNEGERRDMNRLIQTTE